MSHEGHGKEMHAFSLLNNLDPIKTNHTFTWKDMLDKRGYLLLLFRCSRWRDNRNISHNILQNIIHSTKPYRNTLRPLKEKVLQVFKNETASCFSCNACFFKCIVHHWHSVLKKHGSHCTSNNILSPPSLTHPQVKLKQNHQLNWRKTDLSRFFYSTWVRSEKCPSLLQAFFEAPLK